MKTNNLLSKSILMLIAILITSILIYKTTASADKAKPNPHLIRAARLSDTVSVRSTARPTPSINFSDGRDLPTDYDGADRTRIALEDDTASPAALASADFDKDGAPDLICAYRTPGGGVIALHKGNPDSIHPNSSQANQRKASGTFTDAPFLSPARAFELPQSPDFIGAGDFDADGDQDLVVASRARSTLILLSGDGQAGFRAPKAIQLPGAVTAVVTGEMNRADGLADIVVGVMAADGAKALVYESLEGASRATSEVINLPSQITALALGRADDDCLMDLAVAAGKEVFVISGRDRNSLSESKGKTKQPRTSKRRFASAVRSIAIGSFIDKDKPSLAALTDDGALHLLGQSETKKNNGKKSGQINKWNEQTLRLTGRSEQLVQARVSCAQTESLVAIDSVSHQMQIIAADPYAEKQNKASSQSAALSVAVFDVEDGPVAALPVRLNRTALDNLVILRSGQTRPTVMTPQVMMTFIVTDTSDAGVNSFRGAIQAANANPGLDEIRFAVGSGLITINLTGPLPIVNDPVDINGTSQPGSGGRANVEINGTAVTGDGLIITAGNSGVNGLVLNRFGGNAINLASDNNLVILNVIGTDPGTLIAEGNGQAGVLIDGSNNVIGVQNLGNVISANGTSGVSASGVLINGNGNLVQSNFIGTNDLASVPMGNSGDGVTIVNGTANTIGGPIAGAGGLGNFISGNGSNGVAIFDGATANLLQGNFIGTDLSGTAAIPNTFGGVSIASPNNTIGGATPGAGNLVSGNGGPGVRITNASTSGNIVQGNFIGADVSGTAALSNSFSGVELSNGATNNTIGGTAAGAGNVISGNSGPGVIIGFNANPTNNQIQGNFIGVNATGASAIANGSGIVIQNGDNNIIGGANPAARNIISGNFGSGIQANGSGTLVQNNFIGTDATGSLEIGNSVLGFNGGGNNLVIRNNIISGNNSGGILIFDSPGAIIQSNLIGTDASGTQDFGNGEEGIDIVNSPGAIIGGTAAGAGNIIAFNQTGGIVVESGTGQSILSNSIFSNNGLGIDLGGDGVTVNDPGDADAGANNLQNFPEVISANVSLGSTFVEGTLNSAPNTIFTLQFFLNTDCNPSGFGEGKQLIGTRTVLTDGRGNANISFSFPGNFSLPVTATATDPAGNTSEFSPCAVSAVPDLAISMTASPATVKAGDTLTYTITVTNQSAVIATNVTVLDNLPNSVTFVSCAATGNGLCLGSGNNARVTFGALPAGAQATVTLVTTVNALASNDVVVINTATVSATDGDLNPANNSATAITAIAGAPSVIACPANIVINTSAGQCSVAAVYPLPTITDSRFNLTVVCSPPSGSTFPVGVTTVNCLVRDTDAIRGACSFTITINAPQSVRVTLEGGAASLSLGPAKANRKTKNPPDGCDCDSTFTIENTGCAALNLTLDSIMRMGNDVTSGRISNPDDSSTFFVSVTGNNQQETSLAIGAIVSIPVGQSRSFRVLFKPGLPAITGKTTGLAAEDIMPDLITSKITFRQNGIEPIVVNLVGRIVTDVRIINPDDARGPKLGRFTKSGNEFTVIFGVFDADLDASRAMFEFLDGNGQVVQQAFDVDIAQPISQNNIIKGQSFVITQSFTGATSHPEVVSVRVKVSDPHSSDSVTAQLGSSASAATAQASRGGVILPVRKSAQVERASSFSLASSSALALAASSVFSFLCFSSCVALNFSRSNSS